MRVASPTAGHSSSREWHAWSAVVQEGREEPSPAGRPDDRGRPAARGTGSGRWPTRSPAVGPRADDTAGPGRAPPQRPTAAAGPPPPPPATPTPPPAAP